MNKPLSETHPTLWSSLSESQKSRPKAQRWNMSIEQLQCCTVDAAELKRQTTISDKLIEYADNRYAELVLRFRKAIDRLNTITIPDATPEFLEGYKTALDAVSDYIGIARDYECPEHGYFEPETGIRCPICNEPMILE